MAIRELSRTDARRIALRAQLLDDRRSEGALGMVRQLTLLQVDQTAAVAPNADLVAWSRLGSRYSPDELTDAIKGRALVELRGMIRPSEDIALYRAEMAQWPGRDKPKRDWQDVRYEWMQANDACRQDILRRLEADGPLTWRELPDTCVVPWKSSGWNNDRNVAMLVEILVQVGDVACVGYRGNDRLWDLSERVYPDDPPVPLEDARRTRNELRLRSLGIARARGPECPVEPQDVGDAGEAVMIEGVRGQWRVEPTLLDTTFRGRTALVSPIDRSIFDRKRMAELFEFDYQLEMYKPAAKRRWGYYALPILSGDRFIGKLDATTSRKNGVLRVDAIHEDEPFSRDVTAAINAEIEDLARWLDVDLQFTR